MPLFLRQFTKNPAHVGAVAPSGRALARKMAQGLGADTCPVVEIGPGTGAITRGILKTGVPPENLTLIELNPHFCERLNAQFPTVRILNCMAQDMHEQGVQDAAAVISSLPLLNIPQNTQKDILNTIFDVLRPNAPMVQFTYGPISPISHELCHALNLSVERRGKVLLNLPPATVYVYRRAG